MAEGRQLDSHHQATLEKILAHPVSHNIQWHDVLSLLKEVGTVTEKHDGRYAVTVGSETETFDAPGHHDISEQQVVDLRRMLKAAGVA
jgi:thiamine biosynthesis lipoprotein ApbE